MWGCRRFAVLQARSLNVINDGVASFRTTLLIGYRTPMSERFLVRIYLQSNHRRDSIFGKQVTRRWVRGSRWGASEKQDKLHYSQPEASALGKKTLQVT